MSEDILKKIVARKKDEITQAQRNTPISKLKATAEESKDFRSLFNALKSPDRVRIIAEIKRASPSKGDIRADLDPALLAGAYERGGAAALSVLTDKAFFKGILDDLLYAKSAVSIPVMRKDFIISEYQVYESAAAGADAVLLIVRILSRQELEKLFGLCRELSMEALVEVHTRDDLEIALKTGANLIGINNRNLASFETDVNIAAEMAKALGPDRIAVAASGISSRKHIEQNLKANISRFLIGESLVRSDDPETFLKQLING